MNGNVRTILIAVSVFVSTSAHAQTSSGGGPLTQANRPSALRGFSVVLVEGNLRTGPTTESLSLPPAAAKALADLKDFLPYKSFRLLDTQWTMGSGRMTGELRGTEGKSYALEVTHADDLGFGDPASITISRFALSEASASTDRGRAIVRGVAKQSVQWFPRQRGVGMVSRAPADRHILPDEDRRNRRRGHVAAARRYGAHRPAHSCPKRRQSTQRGTITRAWSNG